MPKDKRTTQVNVRFTKDEKIMLTKAAIQKGYTCLGAFLRCAAIAAAKEKA